MCLRALVCLWVWVCVRVRACMYAFVFDDFLLFPYYFFHPPTLFFSPPPSPAYPPPPSPLCVRVCVYVCVLIFPSLFPPALKAALHHTPPLHSPSCFDLCCQGISCVRLMGFSLGTPVFPIHPLGCLELDFCSSFSKVGLYPRRIVYFSCIIFNSFSSRFVPLFSFFLFSSFFVLSLTHFNHCVILFTSRPSPFLV